MVKKIVKFLKEWTLPCAITVGTLVYLTFYWVPQLDELGNRLSPVIDTLFPLSVFMTLFVTFCKIDFHQMRPHRWHAAVLAAQLLLVAVTVAIILWTKQGATAGDSKFFTLHSSLSTIHSSCVPSVASEQSSSALFTNEAPLLWEALLTCIIGPAASASPVVVGKLGGNISTMTGYVLLSSLASAVMIPLVFPMLEQAVHVDFTTAFLIILEKVSTVLLLPLALGWVVQHYLPRLQQRIAVHPNLSFYCWAVSLSITTGITVKNIVHSEAAVSLLIAIAIASLLLCFLQFAIGRGIGRMMSSDNTAKNNRPTEIEINTGQALFQKNTALSIWVAYMYLNPVASIGAGCYVLWQNIINTVEIWQHLRLRIKD